MDDITASIIVACQTTGAINSISKLKYALVQAARYAYNFGQESVAVFSDLEETTQKFNVVFAGMGKKSAGVVKDLIDSYGQSELSAKQMLSATGDLLTGFGLAKSQSLDLAEGVAKLGSDLASFSNYSGGAEGAANALTKAMLGERESLKMLGIVIREDDENYKNFKKQAMSTGVTIDALGKTFKASTQQQAQAIATLAVAYKQGKNSIGDFARNADSIANQSRTMANRMVELKATVGSFINSVMQIGALKGEMGKYLQGITDYIKQNSEEWAYKINEFIISAKTGFKIIWQVANNIMENVGTVIVYAWDVCVQAWKDAPGFFGAVWEDIKLTANNAFETIRTIFIAAFEYWGKVLNSFAENWYSIFVDLGDIAFRSINSISGYFKDSIVSIIKLAGSLGANFWDLITGKKSFSDAIGGVVDDYIQQVKKIAANQSKVWEGFEFGKGTKKFASDIVAAEKERWGKIYSATEKLVGDFGKNTSKYLNKNGVKMGAFTAFDAGVEAQLDKYEKEIKALKSRRGASAEQSAAEESSIANNIAPLMRGLGEAVNKLRTNSLQAIMANSMEGVQLQTRSTYQNIMQQETKKQSSLLGKIASNTSKPMVKVETRTV
jgi:hypothetical protein